MISAVRTAASGVAAASAQFDQAAQAVVSAGTPRGPTDTVDLSAAAIDLIGAQVSVQVNVAMLKQAAKMSAQVLDILA